MVSMGYSRKDIEDSLAQNKYDNLTATYLLLGWATTDVSTWLSARNLGNCLQNYSRFQLTIIFYQILPAVIFT